MSGPKKAKPNAITEITLRTTVNLKTTAPALLQEILKTADKYQKTTEALAALGVTLAEQIGRFGSSVGGDYADGIQKVSVFWRDSEVKRDEVAKSILSDLIMPLRQSAELDQRDILQFEKNYKRDKDTSNQEIVKLEARTKKAGKKTTPEVLRQQISELNDKIKEAETISANRMKEVVLLERKRYSTFMEMCTKVLNKASDNNNDFTTKFAANQPTWATLIAAYGSLPKEIEDMVNKQERTFVQIQASQSDGDYRLSYAPNALQHSASGHVSGAYDSYDSYSSYDNYDQGGGGAAGYDSYGGGAAAGGAQARALYEYASDEPSDLPLNAGDIVTIIQDDDGSGWTKGQNAAGRTGIFPTSYIEYI